MILDDILAYKRIELDKRRRAIPLATLQAHAADRPPSLDMAAALRRAGVGLIAEVKRASPSKGLLCADFDPLRLALTYAACGAAAISVLTDSHFFQGRLAYLDGIKMALSEDGLAVPVLRKDFIFDPYQVYETRAFGADALLLIVAILSDSELASLLELTHQLGLSALVEVHDEQELNRLRQLGRGPSIVGINSRNLRDFSVDLATFERLRPRLPDGAVAVGESGVHNALDVRRLAEMEADAALVGEALVTAPDVAEKVRELVQAGESDRDRELR
ncbi:MAG: indole-3-glycerol phosphate synthase TrpC [Thermoflexales bacterium]|nr:indole-3-glycerol phosphate synthase TrpC [Thermoflexales bacterium]